MVKVWMEHMEKCGCKVGDNFIKVVNCDGETLGTYIPGEGITVCSNQMRIQDDVNQTVTHELIHVYDDFVANFDLTNCAQIACSEIRAYNLSSDCQYYNWAFLRGSMKIIGHDQVNLFLVDCVRRRVMSSMATNPFCSKTAAKDIVEAVWDTCYNDTKPFDKAP